MKEPVWNMQHGRGTVKWIEDYPLPRDPAGPFDVTVFTYIHGERYCFRSPWRMLPTLRDCHAYVIHGKSDLEK